MNRKTPLIIAVLIVVVLLALGWVIQEWERVRVSSVNSLQAVGQSDSANKYANWKVYQDSDLGFEIKYPYDWEAVEKAGDNGDQSVVSLVSPETMKGIKDHTIGYSCDISLYYYPSVSDESENQSKTNDLETMIEENHLIVKIGKTSLGEKDATDVIWGGYGAYYTVLSVRNEHLYKVNFCNKETKESLTETDKKILSSFRFL